MSGYIAGLVILLLLWAAALRPVMAFIIGRLGLKPVQGVLVWAFALALGCALAAGLTVLVLPHSVLVDKWTQAQLEDTARWNLRVDIAVSVLLLAAVYLRLQATAPAPIPAPVPAKKKP